MELGELLASFNSNPPGDPSELLALRAAGLVLPDDYLEFMTGKANGGEGVVGANNLVLWRLEELIEKNREYEVVENAPGLVLFGGNGGGEAFAFDTRKADQPIVIVPMIGMRLRDALSVAPCFQSFLEAVYRDELFNSRRLAL